MCNRRLKCITLILVLKSRTSFFRFFTFEIKEFCGRNFCLLTRKMPWPHLTIIANGKSQTASCMRKLWKHLKTNENWKRLIPLYAIFWIWPLSLCCKNQRKHNVLSVHANPIYNKIGTSRLYRIISKSKRKYVSLLFSCVYLVLESVCWRISWLYMETPATLLSWHGGEAILCKALYISIFICMYFKRTFFSLFFRWIRKYPKIQTHTHLRGKHTHTHAQKQIERNTFALTWNIKYIHNELNSKGEANFSPMAYCRDKLSGFQTLTQNCF